LRREALTHESRKIERKEISERKGEEEGCTTAPNNSSA